MLHTCKYPASSLWKCYTEVVSARKWKFKLLQQVILCVIQNRKAIWNRNTALQSSLVEKTPHVRFREKYVRCGVWKKHLFEKSGDMGLIFVFQGRYNKLFSSSGSMKLWAPNIAFWPSASKFTVCGRDQVGEITWPCHVTGVPTPQFSSNQALNSYAIFQGVGKSHFTKN